MISVSSLVESMKIQTVKEMEKSETIQEVKVEMESLKKTQTEGKLEMKNLGTQTRTAEASLTNRIQRWNGESQALKTR